MVEVPSQQQPLLSVTDIVTNYRCYIVEHLAIVRVMLVLRNQDDGGEDDSLTGGDIKCNK